MESISCAAKRKKRKTRKCLDEIRKRSQRNFNENAGPGRSKTDYKMGNISEMKPNVYITSQRLTLEMFPKVIRSETVTRPALSEINKDYNLDLNNMTMKCSVKPDADELIIIPQPNSDSDCAYSIEDNYVDTINNARESSSGTSQISIQKESDNGSRSTHDNSPGSLPLFSPVHQADDTDLFEVSSKETLPSTSAQSSRCHDSEGQALGSAADLYNEFVSELPMYLEQYAPGLLEGDPMKKTRETLHKLHLESLDKAPDKEDRIYQGMRKEVNIALQELWAQTPRKYMRPGRRAGGPSRDAGQSTPPSASSTAPEPALAPTALLDTPEYTYYPHKLNQ